MNFFNFMTPVFAALENGRIIRFYIAWLLRIFGGVIVLGALYAIIQLLKMAFQGGMPATFTIAALLACIIIVAAALLLLQVSLNRANKILLLGDSEFTIIPIISQYFRWLGEVFASIILIVGLIALIFFIFVGSQGYNPAGSFLPGFLAYGGGGSPIVMIIAIPIVAVSYAVGVIIFFYFLAELVNVAVTIARNTGKLVQMQENAGGAYTTAQSEITGETKACPHCGATNSVDDAFCRNCGKQM